jgi:6-phosphogluconolactonase
MSGSRGRVVVVDDADALAREAAAGFVRRAREAVAARGRFTVALSGGSTPKRLYALLADPAAPFRADMPWDKTHLFWGDERHVPPEDPQSNYGMVRAELLSKVAIPASNGHRIEAELPDAAEAARRYDAELTRAFALAPGEFPRFDWMLLGIGPEGHTASLFPGSTALGEREHSVVSNWVEKFDTFRITMTLPVFSRAAAVAFLVAGADKAEIVRAALDPAGPPDAYPCQLIQPDSGELLWLLDRAAASGLPPS